MAGSLVKNDENSKGTIALWQNVRNFLDIEYPDAKLISEWGEPDKSLKGGFHMDFLLHFGPSHYNDLFRCAEPFFSSRGKGDAGLFVKNYIENYIYKYFTFRIFSIFPYKFHTLSKIFHYVATHFLSITLYLYN